MTDSNHSPIGISRSGPWAGNVLFWWKGHCKVSKAASVALAKSPDLFVLRFQFCHLSVRRHKLGNLPHLQILSLHPECFAAHREQLP